jgi:hypothetical protein
MRCGLGDRGLRLVVHAQIRTTLVFIGGDVYEYSMCTCGMMLKGEQTDPTGVTRVLVGTSTPAAAVGVFSHIRVACVEHLADRPGYSCCADWRGRLLIREGDLEMLLASEDLGRSADRIELTDQARVVVGDFLRPRVMAVGGLVSDMGLDCVNVASGVARAADVWEVPPIKIDEGLRASWLHDACKGSFMTAAQTSTSLFSV